MENLKVRNPQLTQKLTDLRGTISRLRALHRAWWEMNWEAVPIARASGRLSDRESVSSLP